MNGTNTTPTLATLIVAERERRIREDRIGDLAARVRACADPSLVDRLARVLRGTPAAC